MNVKLKSLSTGNLGEQTYEVLVEALMKGSLHAGDRIRIGELAKQLGTSLTPVRDAVLRLLNDEALVMRNPRDIRVPVLSPADYAEIVKIRMELEALAAESAARHAVSEDLLNLESLLEDCERAIRRRDREAFTAANQAFHGQLAVIGQAPILHGVLRRLWMRVGPFIAEGYQRGAQMSNKVHLEIVSAIKAKDCKRAREAVRRDILEGSQGILAANESKPIRARSA